MNEIIDNLELMRSRPVETCRGCASRQIHTRDYGRATIDCMAYLRKENQRLTAERDRWRDRCERLIGHYGNDENWVDNDYVDGSPENEYIFNQTSNGYDFARSMQKEIDDDAN